MWLVHKQCSEKLWPRVEGPSSLPVFCGVGPPGVFAEWMYPSARALSQSSFVPFSGLALAVSLQRRRWTTQRRSAFTMWSVFEKWGMHCCTRDLLEETALLAPVLSLDSVFTQPETKVWECLDFRIWRFHKARKWIFLATCLSEDEKAFFKTSQLHKFRCFFHYCYW